MVLILLYFLSIPLVGMAAEGDPVSLLKRHRYEAAIGVWQKDLSKGLKSIEALRGLKGQALSYFQLGSLYQEFDRFGIALLEEYYSGILPKNKSAEIYCYLGQIQYYSGNFAQSIVSLEQVGTFENNSPEISDLTEVFLYAAKRELNQSVPAKLVLRTNLGKWQLAALSKKNILPKLKARLVRSKRCELKIAVKSKNISSDQIEKKIAGVLATAELPELITNKGKNSQINFYDPFLFRVLSQAYFKMAMFKNELLLKKEKAFPELASKFKTALSLAEVSLEMGKWNEAKKWLKDQTGAKSDILKARLLASENKSNEAVKILKSLSKKTKSPSIRRDIARVYFDKQLDLEGALRLASQAAREKSSASYTRLHASILFGFGDYDRALKTYAKGYKIAYRNRIDHIDPEYMSEYAFAIFRTNKLRYEEVVETLYHLQKEFPACRQMHYAMQGISASLNRGFTSQKIFRKGG